MSEARREFSHKRGTKGTLHYRDLPPGDPSYKKGGNGERVCEGIDEGFLIALCPIGTYPTLLYFWASTGASPLHIVHLLCLLCL